MMNEINNFLVSLFEKEQVAIDASNYKARFEEYNILAMELKTHMADSTVGFGLPVLKNTHPDFFYDDKPTYPNKRYIYKITEYKHKKYGKLWACYVSVANPDVGITKLLSNCFIVARIGGSLKIIVQFNPDYDSLKWSFRGGDRTIQFYKLGTPVSIERLMSPANDDWSIEEYNKNR